jgi:hypothetical protein
MGMLLRHRPAPENMTTTASFGRPEHVEEKPVEIKNDSVKDEKPKTVRRGRPTKK